MATVRRWFIWLKMVFGKSDLHVEQPLGSFIRKDSIYGYYNDFSKKVLADKKHIKDEKFIPQFITDRGARVHFPIQIAQYGLGCYELFLKTRNDTYLKKMLTCSSFLLNEVEKSGGIKCMFFVEGVSNEYSAMCQGECLSLFLRSYKETEDARFLETSSKIFNFLIDERNGLIDSNCFLYEYSGKRLVLNGFIFAIFGVYDYFLATKDEAADSVLTKSVASLCKVLNEFDINGWSYYDLSHNISSPFYHKLHIELLKAIQLLAENGVISECISKWETSYLSKKIRRKMFWKKAMQKVKNK